ncbi:transposase family protein [Rhodococcus opacus]|nr:transposase family protein [Rhodococcus opacus]MDX5962588.1 transposase family protein [Rhodococcus opacus]
MSTAVSEGGSVLGASPVPDAGVLGLLAAVPDPRHRRGVRHRFPAILALALAPTCAGARSFTAIAELGSRCTRCGAEQARSCLRCPERIDDPPHPGARRRDDPGPVARYLDVGAHHDCRNPLRLLVVCLANKCPFGG